MKLSDSKTLKKYDVLNSWMFTNHQEKLDKFRGFKKLPDKTNEHELVKIRNAIFKETNSMSKEI